jgi:hypothetical protein
MKRSYIETAIRWHGNTIGCGICHPLKREGGVIDVGPGIKMYNSSIVIPSGRAVGLCSTRPVSCYLATAHPAQATLNLLVIIGLSHAIQFYAPI